jgi:hypothetical protein
VTAPRTREGQTHRIVGRLREEIADLGASNVHVTWGRDPLIAAGAGGPVLRYTIEIVVDAPDEAAP